MFCIKDIFFLKILKVYQLLYGMCKHFNLLLLIWIWNHAKAQKLILHKSKKKLHEWKNTRSKNTLKLETPWKGG